MIKEDARNIGGRTVIVDKMVNHHRALITAKPTINSWQNNKQTMRRQPKAYYKQMEERQEVMQAFKKVAETKKSTIDNKAPRSSQTAQANRKKKKNPLDEHERNLASMQRRITNIGSKVERKKNSNDPIAHPTYLLRQSHQSQLNNTIDNLFAKVTSKNITTSINTHQTAKLKRQPIIVQPRYQNDIGQKGKDKKKKQKEEEEEEEEIDYKQEYMKKMEMDKVGVEIPRMKDESQMEVQSLKTQIINCIVANLIYEEKDLLDLLDRILMYNNHIDKQLIKHTFFDLVNEFND